MRFLALHARCFGTLGERSFELDAPAVVVHGPNEAGKTTFRTALETVLFGFEPAARDAHPLHRSGQGDLELAADLQLESGGLTVQRVLRDRGQSRLAPLGEPFSGRARSNAPLPAVGDLPSQLYRAIWSLSSRDLVAFDEATRAHVDDLLLGEAALPELRAPHDVLARLRRARQREWRADRRGKTRAAELRAAIERAREHEREARAEEEGLRAARREREALEARIGTARERRAELRREDEDARFLERLARLRRAHEGLIELDTTPLDGAEARDPAAWREELEDTLARQAPWRERLAHPVVAAEPRDEGLLADANRIDALLALEPRHHADRAKLRERVERQMQRLERVERELSRLRVEGSHSRTDDAPSSTGGSPAPGESAWPLADSRRPSEESRDEERIEKEPRRAATWLGGHTDDEEVDLERLASIPLTDLRAAHRSWSELWEEGLGEIDEGGTRAMTLIAWPLALLACLALATDALEARSAAWLLGLATSGLALAALRRREVGEARARDAGVDEWLERAGIDPRRVPRPAALLPWIDALARLVDLATEALVVAERIGDARGELEAREETLARLCRRHELDVPRESARRFEVLRMALASARERSVRAREDREERALAAERLERLEAVAERQRDGLDAMLETLRRSVPTERDPALAYAAFVEARRDHDHCRRLERELRADPAWPRLRDDERPIWRAEAVEAREEESAELEGRIERDARRLGELDERLARDPGSRLARAREERLELEAELRATERRHDRLALLEAVWRRAEREHREEHQPDVLRRASERLAKLTGGRYARLALGPDGTGLEVEGRAAREPVPVAEPLSRGTRDQIHLCLRLALLDHLDAGREALPLVLDEALVHWDAQRRARLYPLLKEAAEKRQLFLLSCHDAIAHEAADALGARLVELAPRAAERSEDEVVAPS